MSVDAPHGRDGRECDGLKLRLALLQRLLVNLGHGNDAVTGLGALLGKDHRLEAQLLARVGRGQQRRLALVLRHLLLDQQLPRHTDTAMSIPCAVDW